MIYIVVFTLTIVSCAIIILLFDRTIFVNLYDRALRNTHKKITKVRKKTNPHHIKIAISSSYKYKSTDSAIISNHNKFKDLSFSFYIISLLIVMMTVVACYWLINYSALDVYHDTETDNDVYNAQVSQLLFGERLSPPPPPPEALFEELDAQIASYQATRVDESWRQAEQTTAELINSDNTSIPSSQNTTNSNGANIQASSQVVSIDEIVEGGGYSTNMLTTHINKGYINIKNADRNWNKMNSEFVQRLLTVYKIMHDQYGYEMVLLEGYRSPERQARLLAKGSHVTKAGSYRSYHQFGLAADSAFIRNGKIVISERDPWAMRGYKLYGKVAKSVGLVWGGDWRMKDLGHVELRKKGVLGRPEMAKILTNQ